LKQGKEMKVVDDQINNPTYIETLVEAILKSIEQKLVGTYIATGPKSFSRFDFAKKIAKYFGLETRKIKRAKTTDFPVKAKRPMNCVTSSLKWQEALGYNFPKLDENFERIASLISKKQ
jgi:dTDP-4-dehydrorhamnose reductase